MASLKTSTAIYHDNFNMTWAGFNDSLPIFVEETLKRIISVDVNSLNE